MKVMDGSELTGSFLCILKPGRETTHLAVRFHPSPLLPSTSWVKLWNKRKKWNEKKTRSSSPWDWSRIAHVSSLRKAHNLQRTQWKNEKPPHSLAHTNAKLQQLHRKLLLIMICDFDSTYFDSQQPTSKRWRFSNSTSTTLKRLEIECWFCIAIALWNSHNCSYFCTLFSPWQLNFATRSHNVCAYVTRMRHDTIECKAFSADLPCNGQSIERELKCRRSQSRGIVQDALDDRLLPVVGKNHNKIPQNDRIKNKSKRCSNRVDINRNCNLIAAPDVPLWPRCMQPFANDFSSPFFFLAALRDCRSVAVPRCDEIAWNRMCISHYAIASTLISKCFRTRGNALTHINNNNSSFPYCARLLLSELSATTSMDAAHRHRSLPMANDRRFFRSAIRSVKMMKFLIIG